MTGQDISPNLIKLIKALMLVSINLASLSFLVDIPGTDVLLELILVVLAILLVAYIVQRRDTIRQVLSQEQRNRLSNSFRLLTTYNRINRKIVLISTAGLLFAMLLLSQTLILPLNVQQQFYDESLERGDTTGMEIISPVETPRRTRAEINDRLADFPEWEQESQERSSELFSGHQVTIQQQHSFIRSSLTIYNGNPIEITGDWTYQSATTWYLDSRVPTLMQQQTGISQDLDLSAYQSVLVADEDTRRMTGENNQLQIIMAYRDSDNNSIIDTLGDLVLYTIAVERIIYLSESDMRTFAQAIKPDDSDDIYLFLRDEPMFDFLDTKYSSLPANYQIKNEGLYFHTEVDITVPKLDRMDSGHLEMVLEDVSSDLNSWLLTEYNRDSLTRSPLLSVLQDFSTNMDRISFLLNIFIIPLVGISIFLMYFSVTLVREKKKHTINLLRQKGLSEDSIWNIALAESLIIGLIPMVVSALLAIPLAYFLLYLTPSITFTGQLLLVRAWLYKFIVYAVTLTADIQYVHTASLLRSDDSAGTGRAHLLTSYLPALSLFSLLVAVAYIILIPQLPFNDVTTLETFYYAIGPLVLGIIILLLPIVSYHYLVPLLDLIFRTLERLRRNLTLLISRNLSSSTPATSKFTSILLISLVLMMSSVAVQDNYDRWGRSQQDYYLGSDVYVEGIDKSNMTRWQMMEVDGVESITQVVKLSMEFETQYGLQRLHILGINTSTFQRAAYWDRSFGELEAILESLEGNGIFTHEDIMRDLSIDTGDKMTIYQSPGNFTQHSFAGELGHFPNLVLEEPVQRGEGNYEYSYIPVLMELSTLKYLITLTERENRIPRGALEYGAYVNVGAQEAIVSVQDSLSGIYSSNLSITVTSTTQQFEGFQQTVYYRMTALGSNLSVLFTSVVITFSFGLYIFRNRVEREQRTGIMRTLGLLDNQLWWVILMEIFLLVFISYLGALLITSLITPHVLRYLIHNSGGQLIPGPKVVHPLHYMLLLPAGMLAGTLLASVLLFRYLVRVIPGDVLRVE